MKPTKIVDSSRIWHYCMPTWQTQPDFIYERAKNATCVGHTMHIIRQMTTHTGTHINTPLYFIVELKSVDQFPIEAFMGEGLVIDPSYKKAEEIIEDLREFLIVKLETIIF